MLSMHSGGNILQSEQFIPENIITKKRPNCKIGLPLTML